MGTYAVTLSDLIEKGGAYAGLAAFFGLAVLAILYFAQAREIRRLRDWAGRAPERAQELEQRVVQQAETARKVTAAPIRRPGTPATPAAQQQATQVVPAVSEDTTSADEEADDQAEDADEEAAAPAEPEIPIAAETAEEGSPTEHEVVTGEEKAAVEDGTDEPATAGTATAVSETATPETNGAPPAEALPPRATQGPAVSRPSQPLRSNPSVTRRPPPRGPLPPITAEEPGGRGKGLVIAGVIAGVVLIIVGIILVFSGGGSDNPKPAATPSSGNQTSSTPAPSKTKSGTKKGNKTSGPSRADTSIAVLNGTTVPGLAGTVNTKLEQAGYTKCQDPTNYTVATRSATVVFYNGSVNRDQAGAIAKSLSVTDVQPIIDDASGLAACADVVVVVGADQTP